MVFHTPVFLALRGNGCVTVIEDKIKIKKYTISFERKFEHDKDELMNDECLFCQ